jgi:hypothetical protein
MSYMKDLDIRIRSGGDDAIAAACQLVPKWIPVSERLPEHESNVLVAAKRDGEYVVKEMLFVDWSKPPEPPRPEWCDDCGGEDVENVTHWMPLPEPPEVA